MSETPSYPRQRKKCRSARVDARSVIEQEQGDMPHSRALTVQRSHQNQIWHLDYPRVEVGIADEF
jgi:hypothetical protein